MRKTIFAVIVSLAATLALAAVVQPKPNEMVMPILGGVDGDTIATRVDALPCPLCRVSIRIRGIDTPEKGAKAKCVREAALAVEASLLTRSLIGTNKTMIVQNPKWDKYGGRIDGEVIIGGKDVGTALIEKGLARPYTGKGPKPDWCTP